MDETTEKMVVKLLGNQFSDATVLSIGHRKGIGQGEYWDKIFKVENNKIIEMDLAHVEKEKIG